MNREKRKAEGEPDHPDTSEDDHHHWWEDAFLDGLVSRVKDGRGSTSELLDWCQRFIKRWHWRGFSPEDCEDLVQDALIDVLEKTNNLSSLRSGEIGTLLRRALERHKKRRQRAKSAQPREMVFDAYRSPSNQVCDHETAVIAVETIQKLSKVLLESIHCELPNLPPVPHDLIVRHYGLEEYFPPKSPAKAFNRSDSERKALYRARSRFIEALERRLKEVVRDADVLNLALEFVRGEKYLQVLDTPKITEELNVNILFGPAAPASVPGSRPSSVRGYEGSCLTPHQEQPAA